MRVNSLTLIKLHVLSIYVIILKRKLSVKITHDDDSVVYFCSNVGLFRIVLWVRVWVRVRGVGPSVFPNQKF